MAQYRKEFLIAGAATIEAASAEDAERQFMRWSCEDFARAGELETEEARQ